LLVDGLKHNLLSIRQFCDSGYEVVFDKNNFTVINDSDKSIVFILKRKCNVYKINFFDLDDQKVVCLMSVGDGKWLWHKCLGHANWRLISKLNKLKFVNGLPELKYHSDALCGTCPKERFIRTLLNLRTLLNFGPVSVASINAKKYALVIVDDYRKCTWVKFLWTKDEAYMTCLATSTLK
jgi:hypothetical protein